jgi:hypothetical protein
MPTPNEAIEASFISPRTVARRLWFRRWASDVDADVRIAHVPPEIVQNSADDGRWKAIAVCHPRLALRDHTEHRLQWLHASARSINAPPSGLNIIGVPAVDRLATRTCRSACIGSERQNGGCPRTSRGTSAHAGA